MASVFVITTIKDHVVLDSSGHGEVVFTVTNGRTRPVRAWAKVVPLEGAKQAWFTIAGENERDFPAQGTHQYSIVIGAAGAPPGQYRFRLYVNSVANPNEFDEGPTVVAEIPVAPPPPPPFRWWKVAVAVLALLVVLGGLIWFLRDTRVPIPPVERKSEADARATLASACTIKFQGQPAPCFKLEVERETSATIPKDLAVRTRPAVGTKVPPGSEVLLVLSDGPEVPDVHIDFEAPKVASERLLQDPYEAAGIRFTAIGHPAAKVGLVWNSKTSACVPPANQDQLLASGVGPDSVGTSGFAIRGELSESRPAGTHVSVDFQTGEGVTVRLRLFSAGGGEVGSATGQVPSQGSCFHGTGGRRGGPLIFFFNQGRKRVSLAAPDEFKAVQFEASAGNVFAIDNFDIQR
jgi:hypothetical protein